MELDLAIFSSLLVPSNIAPAKDFFDSGQLLCVASPKPDLRARIRYTMGQSVQFLSASEDDVSGLIKHWRAELAPDLGEEQVQEAEFNEEDLKDLSSEPFE